MKFAPPPEEAKHLEQLGNNATSYFEKKFPKATAVHGVKWSTIPDVDTLYFLRKSYFDEQAGVQHRVIVVDDFGKDDTQVNILALFKFEDGRMLGSKTPHGVPSAEMPIAPRLYIYTNRLIGDLNRIKEVFKHYQPKTYIEVIDESELHKTLFISYGTPDEEMASRINTALKSKGVDTWFFPEDSIPGDKLHRMMSDAVHKYDRTLLICSEDSIVRGGVLNEIERLLEREASEGGSDIIIPVALDDYIFEGWSPERSDLKRQVTSRVVCKLRDDNFDTQIDKILKALKK